MDDDGFTVGCDTAEVEAGGLTEDRVGVELGLTFVVVE